MSGLRHRPRRQLRSSNAYGYGRSPSIVMQGPYTYASALQEPVPPVGDYRNSQATPYQGYPSQSVAYPSPSYAQILPVLQYVLTNPQKLFDPIDPYLYLPYYARRAQNHTYFQHYFDQFLRQLYRHILLSIPSMYFTRVSRVFKEAGISRAELKGLTRDNKRAKSGSGYGGVADAKESGDPRLASLKPFGDKWAEFVGSLIDEWATLNVVSVLLLSALVSLLSIQDAASSPITRTATLLSLVCSFWSLSYGCVYIVRFGTMKGLHKAAGFAQDIRRRKTSIWWNVLILLAMPAIWLTWSMFFFCVAVMSYVWTSGDITDQPGQTITQTPLRPRAEIGPRVAISTLFGVGIIYFVLVVITFRSYRVDPGDRSFWYTRRKERERNRHHRSSHSYSPRYDETNQYSAYPAYPDTSAIPGGPSAPPVVVVADSRPSSPDSSDDSSSENGTRTPSSPPSYGHGYGQPYTPWPGYPSGPGDYNSYGVTYGSQNPQFPSIQPQIQGQTEQSSQGQPAIADYPPVVPVPPSGYSPPLPPVPAALPPPSSAQANLTDSHVRSQDWDGYGAGSRSDLRVRSYGDGNGAGSRSIRRQRSRSRSRSRSGLSEVREPSSQRIRSQERGRHRRNTHTRSKSRSPSPPLPRHSHRHRDHGDNGRRRLRSPTTVPTPNPSSPDQHRSQSIYTSPTQTPNYLPTPLVPPTVVAPIPTPIPTTGRHVSFDINTDPDADGSSTTSSSSDYISADEYNGGLRGRSGRSGDANDVRVRNGSANVPFRSSATDPVSGSYRLPLTSPEYGERHRSYEYVERKRRRKKERNRHLSIEGDSSDAVPVPVSTNNLWPSAGYAPTTNAGLSLSESMNNPWPLAGYAPTTNAGSSLSESVNDVASPSMENSQRRLSIISERTEPQDITPSPDENQYRSETDVDRNRLSPLPSLSNILTQLENYNTTQTTLLNRQDDIMRYMRELNRWIERDVRMREDGRGR